jgi:hypothetical protein
LQLLVTHVCACCVGVCCCRSVLQQIVGDSEYFLGILPDGSGLAAHFQLGVKVPMQLGRQVLAQLAGIPERWVWAACRGVLWVVRHDLVWSLQVGRQVLAQLAGVPERSVGCVGALSCIRATCRGVLCAGACGW